MAGNRRVMQEIVNQEMAAQRVPFVPNTIGLNWAGPLILDMGTEADKQRYIKNILSAEDIWCQGFSEPDHGSDSGQCAGSGGEGRRRICDQWFQNLDQPR